MMRGIALFLSEKNLAKRRALCYNLFCGLRQPTACAKEVRTRERKDHPKYGKSIVRCVCGETFETGSVKPELKVEICSKCHPFFTGKQKLVDTGGRVDRFKKRFNME